MAVNTMRIYVCDLCRFEHPSGQLTRLGVRAMGDRPEDANNVDVCGTCQDRPVRDVLLFAAKLEEGTSHADSAPAAQGT